jgi:hypothetical protein
MMTCGICLKTELHAKVPSGTFLMCFCIPCTIQGVLKNKPKLVPLLPKPAEKLTESDIKFLHDLHVANPEKKDN